MMSSCSIVCSSASPVRRCDANGRDRPVAAPKSFSRGGEVDVGHRRGLVRVAERAARCGGRSGTRSRIFSFGKHRRAVPVVKVGAVVGHAANLGVEVAVARGRLRAGYSRATSVPPLQLPFAFDLRVEVVRSEFRSHGQPLSGEPGHSSRTISSSASAGTRRQERPERGGRAGFRPGDNGIGDLLVAEGERIGDVATVGSARRPSSGAVSIGLDRRWRTESAGPTRR